MNQHFITAKGMRLAYLEQNPAAKKTIFFIHGNSASSGCWKKQFCSELLIAYRLITFDLPAHGDSHASKEPDKDYTLGGVAVIVSDGINYLSNGPNILCGISLGNSKY